jgi:hypothetical protein
MLATFPLLHDATGLPAITAINWINFPYSHTPKQWKGLYHLPKQLKDLMACYWSVAVLICAVWSYNQLPRRSTSSSSISLLQPQWLYIYKSLITHRVRVARVTWDLGLARWGEVRWVFMALSSRARRLWLDGAEASFEAVTAHLHRLAGVGEPYVLPMMQSIGT